MSRLIELGRKEIVMMMDQLEDSPEMAKCGYSKVVYAKREVDVLFAMLELV